MAYPRKSLWWNVIIPCGLGITFLASVTLIMFWIGATALREAVALERRGVEVEGTITGLWTQDSWLRYRGSYVFTVGGRDFTGEGWADLEIWEKAEVGGKVLIRYVQDEPAISGSQLRRDTVASAGGRYRRALFGLFMALCGVITLRDPCTSFRRGWRQFWLRDHGVMRRATVLATGSDEEACSVTWRDEARVDGQAGGIDKAKCPEVGASILVFAHPVEPWPTVWEGEVGSRVEGGGPPRGGG